MVVRILKEELYKVKRDEMEQNEPLKLNSEILLIDFYNYLQTRKFSNHQPLKPAVFLLLLSGTRK